MYIGVFVTVLIQDPPHFWVGGRVVRNAEFPFWVNLGFDGFDGGFEPRDPRIVDGEKDGDERFVAEIGQTSREICLVDSYERLEAFAVRWIVSESGRFGGSWLPLL